jgi:hypothetical protein
MQYIVVLWTANRTKNEFVWEIDCLYMDHVATYAR